MLNIPACIADQLAQETAQRKVQDLLEQKIYQVLEAIFCQISGEEEPELVPTKI